MLMILVLLAVLLVPLPSLTEGKKVKGFCFVRYEDLYTVPDTVPEGRSCRKKKPINAKRLHIKSIQN